LQPESLQARRSALPRVVGRQIDLGLSEPLPSVWLPLETHQSGYRLTSAAGAPLAGI